MSDLFILGTGKAPDDRLGSSPISEIGSMKLGDRITRYGQSGSVWFFRVFPANDLREKPEAYAFIAQDDGLLGVIRLDVQ